MYSIKVTVKDDKSNYERLIKELEQLQGMKLKIGVFGSDEYAMIAEVHEFGKLIFVPPSHKTTYHKAYKSGDLKKGFSKKSKSNFMMRSQSKGYSIKIPARPFIRGVFEKRREQINKLGMQAVVDIVDGATAQGALETLGHELVNLTKEYLTDLSKPANKPSTIKKKGSSNPLIDTGELRQRIEYKIEGEGVIM